MTAWQDRPQVPALMLNPALLAVLLSEASRGYCGQRDSPAMPVPLAFLVLPLALHRPTRRALPRSTRTYLTTWLAGHPVLRAGFPERAASLVGHTREALRFGARHEVLRVSPEGLEGVVSGSAAHEPTTLELVTAARLAGRWFAVTGPVPTVFQALGVRP